MSVALPSRNYCTLLPYKGHETLGTLLVFWIVLRKEFKHDLLLLVQAQREGDRDEDEYAYTEHTARERGPKCCKYDARIDSDGARHYNIST